MPAPADFRPKNVPGFGSLAKALVALSRYGPGLLGAQKFLVLLFHVERCDTWGSAKTQDAHSIGQALTGVFDRERGAWVRGPCGVGRTCYRKFTDELIAEKVLSRDYIESRRGDQDAPVYKVNWPVLYARVEAYRNDLVGTHSPLLADPTPPDEEPSDPVHSDNSDRSEKSGVCRVAAHGVSSGDIGVCRVATQGMPSGDIPVCRPATPQALNPTQSDPPVDRTPSGALGVTDSIDVFAIRDWLAAHGKPLTGEDPLPGQLAALAKRHGLTTTPLLRFLEDKTEEKQKAKDPILDQPGFWAALIRQRTIDLDVIKWARSRRPYIARLIDADLAQGRRQTPVVSMPKAAIPPEDLPGLPPMVECPQCHAIAAVSHGEILICTSPQCDPRGLMWADLKRRYQVPTQVKELKEQQQ